MTTKPKAKKFRIRRGGQGPTDAPRGEAPQAAPPQPTPETTPVSQSAPEAAAPASDRAARREARLARAAERRAKIAPVEDSPMPTSPEEDMGGLNAMASSAPEQPARGTTAPPASMPAAVSPEQAIAAIRQEGLTGRQLRMARRLAQKHGLAATSDYDAVRLLRETGRDPFSTRNMLEVVSNDSPQLPQTRPQGNTMPSTEMAAPASTREREIGDIQKDIAKRRRRKTLLMFSRLAAFVALPTILAGYYYYTVATPMFSTKSEFLIIQSESSGGAGGIGSLFSGTQMATNQDSIATQSYLQSKDAMLRLDEDESFKAVFSDPSIDPLQRLEENPSNEAAYAIYKKFVKIGYDPTEGVIRMEVSAPDPAISQRYAQALITYAEERVDELSQRKREDQVKDARRSLEQAKADRRAAQTALVELQEGTVLDPEGLIASLRQQISTYEIELQEKQLELTQLYDNPRPNEARVAGVSGSIKRLQGVLDALQDRMTAAKEGEDSLARKTSQIQIAQADLATADLIMQSALQTLKQTELEASRQVRYLTTSVAPVASEDPAYPRKFENTILAFLVFSGIYLMISLTGSILREQVSS
ncbi:capsule biosynthesis protein [Cognatishimia sp.]|uniref:capsule biosynthesis protein n=1 Tax=Cognatishimia sp. TaxID=2211648 RepID=UPI00351407AB